MRAASALAMILLAATPVAAQQSITPVEAARINVTLAAQICMTIYPDSRQQFMAFQAAGFTEVSKEYGSGFFRYAFEAPAGTASIAYVEDGNPDAPPKCEVSSPLLGPAEASAVLDRVVPLIHPRYQRGVRQGPVDPATGRPVECVGYRDPLDTAGQMIWVWSAVPGGPRTACGGAGKTVIFSTWGI